MAHPNFPIELELAKYDITLGPSMTSPEGRALHEVHLLRREVAWLQQDGAPQGLSIQHCSETRGILGRGKISQQFR